ncbi:MAG: hypothetical protein SOH86_08080 [Erysipelotrichaceae bacterium]|jgi:hypothetical protein
MNESTAYLIILITALLCLLIGLIEYRSHRTAPYGFPMPDAGFRVKDVSGWNRHVARLWLYAGLGLMLDLLLYKLTHLPLLTAIIVILIFVLDIILYLKKYVPAYLYVPDDEELWKDVKKK